MRAVIRVIVVLGLSAIAWPTVVAQQAQPPAAATTQPAAKETWEQYQGPEAEQFLQKARVRSMKDLGVGVTLPQKAELELNGVRRFAVFKVIDDMKPGVTTFGTGAPEVNFQDSWQLEIPAYVVDRIIGLKKVPATVERSVNGKTGSMQWWVQSKMTEAERIKQNIQPPDKESWERENQIMKMFDELICNVDRHLNNILITDDFELRFIDHSRSFRAVKDLRDPKRLTRFSQALLDALPKLEYQDLKKKVGRYLMDNQIRTVLLRRDAILALAKTLVEQKGQAAVIFP